MAYLNIPVQFVPSISRLSDNELKRAFAGIADAIEAAGKGKSPLDIRTIQAMVSQLDREFKTLNFDELEKDLIRIDNYIENIDVSGLANKIEKELDSIDLSKLDKELGKIDDIQIDGNVNKMFKSFTDFRFGDQYKNEVKATKAELEALLAVQKQTLKEWQSDVRWLKEGSAAYQNLKEEIKKTEEQLKRFGGGKTNSLAVFNQTTMAVDQVSAAFQNFISVGNEFEATLAAVGAVTGQAGPGLTKLGDAARDLAKVYGGSASSQLKSFQGILSKLGPQVAEDTAALKSMGASVNILSTASGDAADVSMNALVDTMLQLGLVSGDSAKDAASMVQVADALAASAKVGAAEIPQVAQSIIQVGVAAKGANLDVVDTVAGIQLFALGGKQGSEAGVTFRNALGLIQKASGPAEEAMKKLGTSSKELGELLTTKGLNAAFGKLKAGMDTLATDAERNATLMTIFGTENAAGAGILLDNLDKYEEFRQGISKAVTEGAQGADGAIAQANARMNTADAINKRFVARIQDSWISIQQTIGSGASAVISTTAELAPTFTALAGLQTLIPDKAFDSTIAKLKGFKDELGGFSGLTQKLGISELIPDKAFGKASQSITKLGSQMGGQIKSLGAQLGPALTNPYVLGTVAATAALTYFFAETERGKEIWASLEDTAESVWLAFKPLVEGGVAILGEWYNYVIDIGEAVFEWVIFPFEMAFEVIGTVLDVVFELFGGAEMSGDAFSGILDVMKGIKDFLTLLRGGVQDFTDGFRLGKDIVLAFVSGSKDILYAFVEFATTALNPANWLDGDLTAAKDKLTATLEKTMLGAVQKATNKAREAKLGDALTQSATLKADLDKTGKLDELVTKFKNAKTDIEKESIAKSIQEQVPGAVKSIGAVVDEQGKVITKYQIAEDAVKKYADAHEKTLGTKAQKASVQVQQGIQAQANSFNVLQEQAKKLQDDIINQAKAGKDTSSLETRYKSVLEKVAVEGKKVSESISKASELDIPLTGLKLPPQFEAEVNAQMEKVAKNLREKRIGEQLKSSIELKGNLDEQDTIGKLLQKYKTASSEAEKADIGAKLRVSMPGAVKEIIKGVDANGEMIKTLEVNTAMVEQNVAANKQRFSSELTAKGQEFQDSLRKEGSLYQTNITALKGLAEQIKASSDPKQTENLQKQYQELQTKVKGNKDEVITMALETQKLGTKTEEVYTMVADSLGVSTAEAKELVTATQNIGKEASAAAKTVEEMAKAFSEAKSAAQSALDTTKANYQGLLFERQQLLKNKDIREEDRKVRLKAIDDQLRAARAQGKQQVDTVKSANKITAITEELFKTELEKEKEKKSQFELGKQMLSDEEKSASLSEEQLRIDQDRMALLENRERNALDEIRLEREKLSNLVEQKNELKAIFGELVNIGQNGEVTVNVKSTKFKRDSDEKAELDALIKDLNNNIDKAQLTVQSLRVKLQLDEKELERQITALKISELEVDIDLGIRTQDDLVGVVSGYLEDVYKEREKSYEKSVALEEEYDRKRLALSKDASQDEKDVLELEYRQKKLIVNKESLELYQKEVDAKEKARSALKRINDKILEDSKARFDAERSDLEKRFAAEESSASRLIELQKDVRKHALDVTKDSAFEALQKEEEQRVKELDKLRKLDILGEEDAADRKLKIQEQYNNKRKELEEEHRRNTLVVENLARGAEELRKLEQNEKLLRIDVAAKQKEVNEAVRFADLLESKGIDNTAEKQKAAKLKDELGALEDVYKEKGTALGVLTTQLTDTINETLGNIGNSEAVADSFRKLFATIAGALQAQLTGFVMSLVLSPSVSGYLAALPFPANIIALPVVKGLIQTTVKRLTTPLLDGLLSFPTGGRIDSPTLFMAGDGARLGETNREWIFRDSQLKMVVTEAATLGVPSILNRLERIESAILGLNLQFDGRNMRVAVNRVGNDELSRVRR